MTALPFSFLAAGSGALNNYFYRRSTDDSSSPNAFLFTFYAVSLLSAFALNPSIFSQAWNFVPFMIGGFAGLLNVVLMILISNALQTGSSGLTFAFQNASSIFPNLILFGLFGSAFGFIVTAYQLVGMVLVLIGLFLGAGLTGEIKVSKRWILYALGCFAVQALILTIFQWRCLLFCNPPALPHFLIPTTYPENADSWFLPGFFVVALAFVTVLFLQSKDRLSSSQIYYGSLSGVANGVSTFFLLLATKYATPMEKGIIFPLFAVGVIILCNLWGRWFYKEPINIPANATLSAGIVIASLG